MQNPALSFKNTTSAIIQAARTSAPDPLILALGNVLTPELRHVLRSFDKQKDVVIAIAQTPEFENLHPELSQNFPKAEYPDPDTSAVDGPSQTGDEFYAQAAIATPTETH